MSRVVVSPSALHRLKASPPSRPVSRGMCRHVLASTLHQGPLLSPPGFAQTLLYAYLCPVRSEVCSQLALHWQPAQQRKSDHRSTRPTWIFDMRWSDLGKACA